MSSTNRGETEEAVFFNLNELELSSTEFLEIVTLFQTLRKWRKESTSPEVDTIEPNSTCEK